MTSKMLQAYCLGFFCALALAVNAQCHGSAVYISTRTLKSDLDLILEDPASPPNINIEYADGAVLSLSVLPKRKGEGMYVQFDGELNIKLPNRSILKRKDLVYTDGLFGLPSNYDNTAYIKITPDKKKSVKPALTIRYISVKQLTKDLQEVFQDVKNTDHYSVTSFAWPNFRIGLSSTSMELSPEDRRLLLKKPLKGIALHGEDFTDESCCEIFKAIGPTDAGSSEASSHQSHKQFDVLFDVWFDPKSKSFGTSSGPIAWVDAVRIYDERSQDIKREAAELVKVEERHGEDIRKRVFEQDMSFAFRLLHSEDQTYENVLIDYANDIILDVRRGEDGKHRYVTATGTTKGDTTERKTKNVKAHYDLQKLEYSDQVATDEKFVLESYEDKSSSLRYIDWSTFQRHLKGMWTSLQGACKDQTRIYNFSIYGGNVRANYECRTKTLALQDTISVLTDIEISGKAVVTKLENVRYRERLGLESPSLSTDMTPTAIQLIQRLPYKYSGQVNANVEVFKDEIKSIKTALIRNKKSKSMTDELTKGTIILNEKLLFEVKLPGDESLDYVKIDGNFAKRSEPEVISHKTLNFNEDGFSTSSGVEVKDVFIPKRYKPFNHESINKYVIGSKYLTLTGLTLLLRKVLDKATKRCASREVKTLWFKLVQHNKFAFSGFCDCSQSVMLVEGKFRALLLTKNDGKSEVHTDRFIQDLIYMKEGDLLIPGSGTLDDVYVISVPELTNRGAVRKYFGAPVPIHVDTYLVFKSED